MRFVVALLLVSLAAFAARADDKLDPETGLKIAPNWELAAAQCGGCHSHQLVTAQRGDREYWLQLIRWMQRTQNLWPIPAEIEEPLLEYLATNYNETDWGRRPPLPPTLLPGVAKQ
ncbi:MAG: hypothetical protein IPG25_17535 [Proteobacteria bacterium]|nr:hypothetical protein [Pseudomonadota bacterium]